MPRILELLDQLDVQATFFVPGWVAERRSHHSYSHRSATELSPQEQRADFERALDVFDRQGAATLRPRCLPGGGAER